MREITQPPQEEVAIKRGPLFALFGANAISSVGDYMTFLAVPWFVLQTTGSITKTGITAFFGAVPTILSAFLGSTIVDRLGYKRTSVIGDIASGISVALIPLLYHTIGLVFWQLLALVFLGGLLKAPGSTARASMIPDLAKIAAMPLERANAGTDGIQRVSGFIGAPIAGILILVIGTSNLLWLDATSFIVSALLIALFVPPSSTIAKKEGTSHYLTDLQEGIQFILRSKLLLAIEVTVLVTNLLDAGLSSVVLPAYIKQVFGSPVPLGFMVAVSGGTAFLGTLLFGVIGHRLPRRLTFTIGFTLGGGIRILMLALLPILPILLITQAISGLCIAPINPIIYTILQERVPSEMRARIFGTTTAGVLLGVPIGTLISGYAATLVGLRTTLLIMGIVYVLTTLSLLVNPALKTMDAKM